MNDLRDSNNPKVKTALEVNCNRKLVAPVLSKKRSSQLNKLLKIN